MSAEQFDFLKERMAADLAAIEAELEIEQAKNDLGDGTVGCLLLF
jgi:hypothetical protein